MSEQHDLLAGRVHLYKRGNSTAWQCSTYLAGRNHRVSTKEENLVRAKEFAEDWFLELKAMLRSGELKSGKTFKFAAKKFLDEYGAVTRGERNPDYVKGHGDRLRVHLLPFFGNKVLSDITPGLVQEYRGKRLSSDRRPSRSTLHHEIVTLRQVLKAASRHGWLQYLPDLSAPYGTSGKITHRAWFSPAEYKTLYEATRAKAKKPPSKRWKWASEQLHDYVLFMANTGLRPDEAGRLQFRDVSVVDDEATGERILEIEVRGKRGVGYCKSTSNAVLPFERLKKRPRPLTREESAELKRNPDKVIAQVLPAPTDLLFPGNHEKLLNNLLRKIDLKRDRDGKRRTAYSLRHTYICVRLMEGADIYQIAKNCRTSVEMIEKFYAAHLKNTLDAAAINVRKSKAQRIN